MKRAFVIVFALISIISYGQGQFSSAGKEFCFSLIQNRIDKNGAPTNCLLTGVKVGFVVSNNTQYNAQIEIDFSGNNVDYMINDTLNVTGISDNIHQFYVGADQSMMVEVIPANSVTFNDPCPGATQTTLPDIRDAMLMNNGQIQSKVYWVRSLNNIDVTVYAETSQGNSRDASLILPTHSLGYMYYAMSYQPNPLEYSTIHYGSNLGGPSEIGIISQYDNCEIFFELPPVISNIQVAESNIDGTNNNTINGGVVHAITLNKGESYQIQSDDFDLTGTRIWSDDRAFAAFSGNMAIDIIGVPGFSIYAFDQTYTQLFPVKNWGNTYIVTPIPNNIDDLIKVVALEDSTEIFMNGISQGIINNGEHLEFDLLNGNTAFIETNGLTIQVSQYSKSSHYANGTHQNYDPSLLLVPTLSQTIEEITFPVLPEVDYSNPNCNNNVKKDYVSIIAHNSELSDIMIDDFINPVSTVSLYSVIHTPWTVVSGIPDYSYCILNVSNNSVTSASQYHLYMTGNPVFGFNAVVHGLDCGESYAYAAGINIIVDTLSALDVNYSYSSNNCPGDSIFFNLYSNLPLDSIEWNFNDISSGLLNTSNIQNPIHVFEQEGFYNVNVIAYSAGLIDYSAQSIFISSLPDFTFSQDTLLVVGFPVEIVATTSGCTYLWSNSLTTESIFVDIEGMYNVTVTNSSGCYVEDSVFVVQDIGIDQFDSNSRIKIYPNPVKDELTIEGLQAGDRVQLMGILGNIVTGSKVIQGSFKIGLSEIPAGVYFLRVVRGNYVKEFKFMKE